MRSSAHKATRASSPSTCAELALEFAERTLREGGDLLMKVFQGEGYEALVKQVRARFETVTVRKPKASRPRSREVYLLARNHRA